MSDATKIPPQRVEICPTCGQSIPRDAMTTNPHGSAPIVCGICGARASFIIFGGARCVAHKKD